MATTRRELMGRAALGAALVGWGARLARADEGQTDADSARMVAETVVGLLQGRVPLSFDPVEAAP